MANFQPATPSRRRRAQADTPRTPEEELRLRLGARRHGCYTFVFAMLGLVWVMALAGLGPATMAWGWWGLTVAALPVIPTLARYRITNAIFNFTIRNTDVGHGDPS